MAENGGRGKQKRYSQILTPVREKSILEEHWTCIKPINCFVTLIGKIKKLMFLNTETQK